MGVPAHDERDFEFALKYKLPIKPVIRHPLGERTDPPWKPRVRRVWGLHQFGPVQRPGLSGGGRCNRRRPGQEEARREAGAVAPARLGHLAPALLGHADPDRALRGVRRRAGAGRAAAGAAAGGRGARRHRQSAQQAAVVPRHEVPVVRQAGEARDRHHGHVRRLVVVFRALLLPRPGQGDGRRARQLLDAGRPVHRRHRARHPAPAVLALLPARDARRDRPDAEASPSRSPTCSRRAWCSPSPTTPTPAAGASGSIRRTSRWRRDAKGNIVSAKAKRRKSRWSTTASARCRSRRTTASTRRR